MQTALVILIVAAAAVYVGRVAYNGFMHKQDCACGCTGCGIADTCTESQDRHSRDISTE